MNSTGRIFFRIITCWGISLSTFSYTHLLKEEWVYNVVIYCPILFVDLSRSPENASAGPKFVLK